MAQAVEVLASAATTLVAAGSSHRSGILRNQGGETIYVSTDTAATVASGFPVHSGETYSFTVTPGEACTAIAASVDQSSPADTRVETAGVPG